MHTAQIHSENMLLNVTTNILTNDGSGWFTHVIWSLFWHIDICHKPWTYEILKKCEVKVSRYLQPYSFKVLNMCHVNPSIPNVLTYIIIGLLLLTCEKVKKRTTNSTCGHKRSTGPYTQHYLCLFSVLPKALINILYPKWWKIASIMIMHVCVSLRPNNVETTGF